MTTLKFDKVSTQASPLADNHGNLVSFFCTTSNKSYFSSNQRSFDTNISDKAFSSKYFVSKLERKYNKGKALGIYTHKLGQAICFMFKNKEAFDMKRFFDQ